MAATVTLRAHAKLNLYLRIVGSRPDGYHDLISIFQAVELADTLEFVPERGRGDLHLRSTDPGLPDGSDNLIHRAWRLLRDRFGDRVADPGLRCRIEKRIPMQAGLGGGSADAAATLVALNRLWDLQLSPSALRTLALDLGSDVPFPLLGGTALGTGRGETLLPLPPIPETFLLVAIPPVGVSTREAFGWWDAAATHDPPGIVSHNEVRRLWEQAIHAGDWPQYLHNDFEAVVCTQVPVIGQVRDAMRNAGLPTVMTGSGSTILGFCTSYEEALTQAQGWRPVAGERVLVTATRSGSGVA